MKILGLAGSPRKGGNTDVLLGQFLRGAQSAGAQTETIRLVDLKVAPCIGCEKCFEKGTCWNHDDALIMYDKMLSADIVVLASPVYFYTVSAQAKMLIDRCQALWARRHVLKQKDWAPGGRGVLIATGGSKGKDLFDGMKLTAKYFFDALGKTLDGTLCYRKVDEMKAILDHPEILDEVESSGIKFMTEPEFKIFKE